MTMPRSLQVVSDTADALSPLDAERLRSRLALLEITLLDCASFATTQPFGRRTADYLRRAVTRLGLRAELEVQDRRRDVDAR